MSSSLACFLVLVLQVQVIRGQLAQNIADWEGRSVVPEPGGYKVGNVSKTRGSVLTHFQTPKRREN